MVSIKGIVRDVVIVAVSIAIIWISLQAYFGTSNPFYVVSSGSMYPTLAMYDIIVISGHAQFDDVKVGDVIVFDRPKDLEKVIVHRVVAVVDDDPKLLRTKGDNNQTSIPGTDFPITKENYLGTVEYIIPQVGFITKILQPPINYIIIAVIVGIMIVRHISKRKTKKEIGDDIHDDLQSYQKGYTPSNYDEYIKSEDTANEERKFSKKVDEENIKLKDIPGFFLDKDKESEEKKE